MILAATATAATLAAAFNVLYFCSPGRRGRIYGFINGIFNVVKTEPRVGGDGGDRCTQVQGCFS